MTHGHPTSGAAARSSADHAPDGRAPRSPMYLGIFFLFAPLMIFFVSGISPQRPPWLLLIWCVISGLVGVGWAAAFTISRRLLWIVIPFHAASIVSGVIQWPPWLALAGARPTVEGLAVIACIALGYILIVRHIRIEAGRAERMQTELDVARRIHDSLVPPVRLAAPGLEVFGRSDPSTEMGGDLLDVVARAGCIDLYLADVAGHGVRAGVLMAMVKSAIRTRLLHASTSGDALASIVHDLNQVVAQVAQPDMFVTLSCLRFAGPGEAEFALAGHLPILHLVSATGEVRLLPNESLPLGVDRHEHFVSGRTACAAGDLFVLLTDGLTEAASPAGVQLGQTRLVELIARNSHRPLPELFEAIMAAVRAHAVQTDDQTLLLARVT